ncbi:MAG: 23S rRNA (pseudouridine(1915)-N(3))-methyltransferase RlmH [Candidatus Wallbacteria bacterium]|nr:23S rRNA (pseudouridine(1915)-N(3))-methyltransferase RlmH [Candidatus Wallbacteria bacterium]
MVELRLACVGGLRQSWCRDGAELYAKRLRSYAKLELREVRAGTAAQDCQRLAKAVEGCRTVLVLDRVGKELDSAALAQMLATSMERGLVPIGLVVGGADGLPAEFAPPGAQRVSFSRLTFPHELFRVLLLEQLYRAFTILRGEPYHGGH